MHHRLICIILLVSDESLLTSVDARGSTFMVHAAVGFGYSALEACGEPLLDYLSRLPEDSRPSVLVLSANYGGRKMAARIRAEFTNTETESALRVIGIRQEMQTLNLNIFGICKSIMYGISTGKALVDIENEIEIGPETVLSAHAASAESTEFNVSLRSIPFTNIARYDPRTSTVELERELRELQLAVADVASVHNLVTGILRGGRSSRVHVVGSDVSSENQRSRAIALEACKVFLFGDLSFNYVYRLPEFAHPDDAICAEIKDLAAPCLIWIDLVAAPPENIREIMSSWPTQCRFILTSAFAYAQAASVASVVLDFEHEEIEHCEHDEKASELHEDIHLNAHYNLDSSPRDLRAVYGSQELAEAINKALPADCFVAALYDENDDSTVVRVNVSGVRTLHLLRDYVFDGQFDDILNQELSSRPLGLSVIVNKTKFAVM